MSGAITARDIRKALVGIVARLRESEEELNALDAELGDGDLGTTLASVVAAIDPRVESLPDDIGAALTEIAKAIGSVSGSSFSGLMIVGLLRAASLTRGKTQILESEVGPILQGSLEAMIERGGAGLGDKTMLDGLAALADAPTGTDLELPLARAISTFRDRPCRSGRARLAADRSVGRDDPGMVALMRMIEGLAMANAQPKKATA
jgi:dihydroxyacetone kinase-like protein